MAFLNPKKPLTTCVAETCDNCCQPDAAPARLCEAYLTRFYVLLYNGPIVE